MGTVNEEEEGSTERWGCKRGRGGFHREVGVVNEEEEGSTEMWGL